VVYDNGDHEFLMTNELQFCHIVYPPPHIDNSTTTVETVAEGDNDPPYLSPMDDALLDQ